MNLYVNDSIEKVKKIAKEIHKFNFGEAGIIKHSNFDENTFSIGSADVYDLEKEEFCETYRVSDYCKICDELGCDRCKSTCSCKCEKKDNFQLKNISHGSHSIDFLEAMGYNTDELLVNNDWTSKPVIFLMENPSYDYDIYDWINDKKTGKRPAKKWYWIHRSLIDERDYFYDDTYLINKKYGEMVAALICQFKLANAYLTNAIKCGMSDTRYEDGKVNETKYLGTWCYSDSCKKNCLGKILKEEISIIRGEEKEVYIFAFGGNAYNLCSELIRNIGEEDCKYYIAQLPHPSARMNNKYRPYILKGIMEDVLIDKNEKYLYKKLSDFSIDSILNCMKKNIPDLDNKIKIGKNRRDSEILVKVMEENSIFDSEKKTIKEITFRGDKDNVLFGGNYGFGYNFYTDEFWCWNYDLNEYMEPNILMEPYYRAFENAINIAY